MRHVLQLRMDPRTKKKNKYTPYCVLLFYCVLLDSIGFSQGGQTGGYNQGDAIMIAGGGGGSEGNNGNANGQHVSTSTHIARN